MPRLIIAEPGAVGGGGHYAGYVRAVAQGAREAGLEVWVACNRRGVDLDLGEGVRVLPVLDTVWHEADARRRDSAADGIAADLARALAAATPGADDHMLYPTLGAADLASVLGAFVETPAHVDPPWTHLLLRYDPEGFAADAERLRSLLSGLAAAPALAARLKLHSDTEPLAAAYAELLGRQVTRLPIPFPQAALLAHLAEPRPSPPPLRIAFLGDARAEKRFVDVAEAIEAVWDELVASGQAVFSLQCHFSATGSEPAIAAAVERLSRRGSDAVELTPYALEEEAYYARLAGTDAVLIPYDPARYARRSSGVLVEALAAGKPVVVPAGSWMATQAGPDNAVVYDPGEGLAAALRRLVRDYPTLAAGAAERADAARRAATGGAFVQAVLATAADAPGDGSGDAEPEDIEAAYRILLGRRPESVETLQGLLGASPGALIGGIVSSGEFDMGLGAPPPEARADGRLDAPPPAAAARRLVRFAGAEPVLAAARETRGLLAGLLADPALLAQLPRDAAAKAARVAAGLEQAPPSAPPPPLAELGRPAWSVDEGPEVDLFILAEGDAAEVAACLRAVQAQAQAPPTRVFLFGDGTLGAGGEPAPAWVRVLPRPPGLDAARVAAAAALGATAPLTAVLSASVQPRSQWLATLARAFRLLPSAGLVGGALHDAAGGLREVGGVLWEDGATWPFGCGDDPRRSRYGHARPVDFVSDRAFMVRTPLWRELEGFDPGFGGGPLAAADLAFRAADRGWRTWVQPNAAAVAVSPTARPSAEARERFLQRWGARIAAFGRDGADPLEVMDRSGRPRVLVLEAQPLTPDRDAGSVVALSMIRLFQARGWSVGFAATRAFDRDPILDAELNETGVETFRAPIATAVADIVAERPGFYDAVLGLRHGVLGPELARLREGFPLARILFHNQDMHHLRLAREAALRGDARAGRAAELEKGDELAVFADADCSLVTSAEEARVVAEELPGAKVVVLPYVEAVRRDTPGFARRRDLVFVGGFGHAPNLDAALHLAERLWPRLASRLPADARLLIVGAAPPPALIRLQDARLRVLGHVRELAAVLDAARISLVPLRYGAGVKGKLVSALSAGLPSVVTPAAAEGKGLLDGEHALIAEDDDAFVEAVVRLHGDAELWERLQQGGWRFAETHYSQEAGSRRLEQALELADAAWWERAQRTRRRRLRDLGAGV